MLRAIATELAEDRGGWEHCTTGERILIERCAAVTLLCSSIEAHVFKGNGPVTPNGELLSVLRKGYISHFAALTRALTELGLRPERANQPRVPSIAQFMAERARAKDATESHEPWEE
jgi:hypothetical protein